MTVNLYVTDDRPRPTPCVFQGKCALRQPRQISCVFSGNMRLAANVTVNSYDTRPTAPGFRIFFQLKRASRKPFQIPCVFSMKVCLAFKVVVNLYVMRSIAPTSLVFFRRKCASQESRRIRWVHFPCVFSGSPRLAFRSDCEFTCDTANRSRIPNLFSTKTCVAEPLLDSRCLFNDNASCVQGDCKCTCDAVFSRKMNLGFTSDAANRSRTPFVFPRKTRLSGGIPRGHCHCKCSFAPKPGRRPNVDKGAL